MCGMSFRTYIRNMVSIKRVSILVQHLPGVHAAAAAGLISLITLVDIRRLYLVVSSPVRSAVQLQARTDEEQ